MPTLHFTQVLPAPLQDVFAFHADPYNLLKITPPGLNLRVTNKEKAIMAKGLRIRYRIRMAGVPLPWESEITEYDPPHAFTDVQLRGPYKTWEHTHLFQADGPDRTIVTDKIYYEVPLGLPGRIIAGWAVARQLDGIFAHRTQALKAHFPG